MCTHAEMIFSLCESVYLSPVFSNFTTVLVCCHSLYQAFICTLLLWKHFWDILLLFNFFSAFVFWISIQMLDLLCWSFSFIVFSLMFHSISLSSILWEISSPFQPFYSLFHFCCYFFNSQEGFSSIFNCSILFLLMYAVMQYLFPLLSLKRC